MTCMGQKQKGIENFLGVAKYFMNEGEDTYEKNYNIEDKRNFHLWQDQSILIILTICLNGLIV